MSNNKDIGSPSNRTPNGARKYNKKNHHNHNHNNNKHRGINNNNNNNR